MAESKEAHRDRDARVWGWLLLGSWLFPSIRGWVAVLMVATGCAWALNILGESGVFNGPDILYASTDPVTGTTRLTVGCRADRLKPDGACDTSINLDTIRRAFPFFGKSRP